MPSIQHIDAFVIKIVKRYDGQRATRLCSMSETHYVAKHNIKSDSSALFITARDLQLRENAELPISLPSRILGVLNLHME